MDRINRIFLSQIKSINEVERSLVAYVSTDTKDRSGEVLLPEGIDLKNYRKNPVVLWAHDYAKPPIGKAMWVKKDGKGIISKVQFADTEFAKEIFELYKGGFLSAFSVGFIPKEYEDGDGDKKPRRTYTKWEMLEYSAVPVPANPDAVGMAIKKGILKTDSIIKQIEDFDDNSEDWGGEYKENENSSTATTVVIKNIKGLDELMADNISLLSQIEDKDKEISALKVKLFSTLTTLEKIAQSKSEIADDNLADKVFEIVNGAIRKAKGTVD